MEEDNELKSQDMIDNFLKSIRLLANHISKIVMNAIKTTDICQLDKKICSKIDYNNKLNNIKTKLYALGITDEEYYAVLDAIVKNTIDEKFDFSSIVTSTFIPRQMFINIINDKTYDRSLSIESAYEKIKSYRRLSFVLDRPDKENNKKGGYTWDKFFDKEEDEPEAEKTYRMMLNSNSMRDKFRKSIIEDFLKHIYVYIDYIIKKDINFLIKDLNRLFSSNSEFADKISIIFGDIKEDSNCEEKISKYVTEKDISTIWNLIISCIKSSTCYYHINKIEDVEISKDTFKKIDYAKLKQAFNVDI